MCTTHYTTEQKLFIGIAFSTLFSPKKKILRKILVPRAKIDFDPDISQKLAVCHLSEGFLYKQTSASITMQGAEKEKGWDLKGREKL